jgi:hypothetical protein
LSAGILHLSSHLTRDLDRKEAEERGRGHPIPTVADPDQYNVFYLKAYRRFPAYPLAPALELAIQPVNFHYNGRAAGDVRPVYLGTRSTLWRRGEVSLVLGTRHEIGPRPVNQFLAILELYARDQPEGRLQGFLSVSPGHEIHVSPHIGGMRDGIALGVRLKFLAQGSSAG